MFKIKMNKNILLKDKKELYKAIETTKYLFYHYKNGLSNATENAMKIRQKLSDIDQFVQQNTSTICPHCKNVCCINRHGYYELEDLIYILALGLNPEVYNEELHDTDPCRFLTTKGCIMDRTVRPFRCNWYFCTALLERFESGPLKPYRYFINQFSEIIELRKDMLDRFSFYSSLSNSLRVGNSVRSFSPKY